MEQISKGRQFTEEEYEEAIKFALNYPPVVKAKKYDEEKDIFRVLLFDAGWYHMKLEGKFVRSCLKWQGIKKWRHEDEKISCKDSTD